VVIFSALVLLGVYSYSQLNYELLPKISTPVITISTVYPGASPNEVETSVTKPVEDAISTLDQVDYVSSTSSEGVSFVVIQFLQSADVDIQLQSAQRKVNQVLNTLPSDIKTPILSKFALDEIPVLRMGITSNMAPKQFYQFVVDRIQPRISKIAGVGQITLTGGDRREIKVNLNADKIKSYGLSILQVVQSIQSSNLDFPAGKLENNSKQFVVRLAGKFNSLNTLKSLIVAHLANGSNVQLEDIAEVD
jgi:HAE1 family hydrophobic/amphiphilic exporter-1